VPPVAGEPAAQRTEDRVLARIDGKPVMESDFLVFLDMAYNPQQRLQIGMAEGAMQQIQDTYLQTRLFEAKARKDGLDQGPAFARKRAMLETDLLVRSLFDRDGAALQEKVKVSDEDVKAYYESHLDLFKTPETFSARHILVGTKDSPTANGKGLTDEQAQAKVAKIQGALKAGKKLKDLTKTNSDDPGSKDKGGLYENIPFGSFTPEFEAAVRQQAVGKVGKPVKTPFGYHLIQVEKITPAKVASFEASKDRAQQMATQAKQEQVMKEFVDSIKKEIPYEEVAEASKTPAPQADQTPAAGSK
jgi:peptidyl-prolyl cis-trans isomerase C